MPSEKPNQVDWSAVDARLAAEKPFQGCRAVVVEYKSDIRKTLLKSYSRRQIYQAMINTGILKCSYTSFTRALRQEGIGKVPSADKGTLSFHHPAIPDQNLGETVK